MIKVFTSIAEMGMDKIKKDLGDIVEKEQNWRTKKM